MAESSSTIPVELNQEYRVKLGKSFTFPKENAFHSIKYDFKPKSIDPSQPGRLKVNGDEVTVFMPVLQAESAEDVAMFKGAGKPCRKECILIINTDTGEAVLEKISNTVNLKGVRDLTKRKKVRSMSPAPQKTTPTPAQQKPSSNKTTVQQTPKSSGRENKKSSKKDTKSEKQTQFVPATNSKPPTISSSYQSTNILTLPKPISPLRSNNPTPEPVLPAKKSKVSVSSNSDDSSSSFSGSDDSDSEMDQSNSSLPTQQFTNVPPTTALPIFPSNQSTVNQSTNQNTYNNMPSFLLDGEGHNNPAAMNTSILSLSSSSSSSSGESSSSSTSESESESSDNNEDESVLQHHSNPVTAPQSIQRPRTISVLKKDLELSDSDDEDSD